MTATGREQSSHMGISFNKDFAQQPRFQSQLWCQGLPVLTTFTHTPNTPNAVAKLKISRLSNGAFYGIPPYQCPVE